MVGLSDLAIRISFLFFLSCNFTVVAETFFTQAEVKEAYSGGQGTVFVENKNAYSLPLKNLKVEKRINFFVGNFDFSDDKQSSRLVGFQHQNNNLSRDTLIGNISPITGGFITKKSAKYIYTGFEWNVNMGRLTFTPSFAPGLYDKGDVKDLGHILDFK